MQALITGITGQDGSYLAEYLLSLGYRVIGLIRRTSTTNLKNIQHLLANPNLILVYGDVTDKSCIDNIFSKYPITDVYNLAAQSFVPTSWEAPVYTTNVNFLGPLNILESIREHNRKIRFYQASTSEMFGKVQGSPQNEKTPFYPRSPYGVSKVAAHYLTVNYRESFDIFASSGILFNHESPRRGEEFVTRKITKGLAEIFWGKRNELVLGNLEAKRDWGFAGDYVKAMHLILQHSEPDTFVIGMGEQHSVREFCEKAFSYVGLNYLDYVKESDSYKRYAEVDTLLADASKAKNVLGWKPETSFERLVHLMVEEDIRKVKNGEM